MKPHGALYIYNAVQSPISPVLIQRSLDLIGPFPPYRAPLALVLAPGPGPPFPSKLGDSECCAPSGRRWIGKLVKA